MFQMIDGKEILTKNNARKKYSKYNVLFEYTDIDNDLGFAVAIADSDRTSRLKLSNLLKEFLQNGYDVYLINNSGSDCNFGDLTVVDWEVK